MRSELLIVRKLGAVFVAALLLVGSSSLIMSPANATEASASSASPEAASGEAEATEPTVEAPPEQVEPSLAASPTPVPTPEPAIEVDTSEKPATSQVDPATQTGQGQQVSEPTDAAKQAESVPAPAASSDVPSSGAQAAQLAPGVLATPTIIPATSPWSLNWGVKESFRNYIVGTIAHGTITYGDGATLNTDGTYRFDFDRVEANTVFYKGTVVFYGHDGQLDMTLTNIRVVLEGNLSRLVADVTSRSLTSAAPVQYPANNFADIDLTQATRVEDGEQVSYTNAKTTLSSDGVVPFASFYAAGTQLDPMSFSYSTAVPVTIPESGPTRTVSTVTVTPESITEDESVRIVAAVTPSSAQGEFVFRVDGKRVGQKQLNANGRAALRVKDLKPGTREITVRFVSSDPTAYVNSRSSAVNVVVEKVQTQSTSTKKTTADLADGSLRWGFKSSFRSYVTGNIAKGAISVSGGATVSGGVFAFGQSSTSTYSAKTGNGSASYSGTMRFTGHSGLLDLTIANPTITVKNDSTAVLSATVNGSRTTLANLGLPSPQRDGDAVTFRGASATLAAAAVGHFAYNGNSFYQAGESLDPVTFTMGSTSTVSGARGVVAANAASQAENAWVMPLNPPATSGLTVVPAQPEPGGQITITGGGFAASESDIRVVLYSDPTVLDEGLTADASGNIRWTGTLPADLTGTHTITVQGSDHSLGAVVDFAQEESAETQARCEITDASIAWGFKESFRSYISGSIANGAWEVSDGATYETPVFGFADGTGDFDATAGSGEVSFTGSIRFTGHDGALDLVVSDPVLVFDGTSEALLLMNVSGKELEGGEFSYTDVPFVTVQLPNDGTFASGKEHAFEAPTLLTEQGASAFSGFYEAGAEFDPISVVLTTSADCSDAASTAPVAEEEVPTEDGAQQSADEESSSGLPVWLMVVLGIAALLIVGAGCFLIGAKVQSRKVEPHE